MPTHDVDNSHPSCSKRRLRRSRPVAAIVALLGVIAIAVAGCGGGSGSGAAPAASASASSSAGIPQHNGGDQDADNNGGPSDGDGQI